MEGPGAPLHCSSAIKPACTSFGVRLCVFAKEEYATTLNDSRSTGVRMLGCCTLNERNGYPHFCCAYSFMPSTVACISQDERGRGIM